MVREMLKAEVYEMIRRGRPAILDVRTAAAFAAGHLRGAVSVPCPKAAAGDLSKLDDELPSIFLPPRHRPLVVVAGEAAVAGNLAAVLAARGREHVCAYTLAGGEAEALPADLWERGRSVAQLWEVPRFLADHARFLPPPVLGPVLDLGCGSGRVAVWLAEKRFRVTGIDWQPEALALGRRLAASRNVDVDFVSGDLRDAAVTPPGPWAVVMNFRYLQRDLLPRLERLLCAGGVAMIRTFRDAPGLAAGVQARHRLRAAELPSAFAAGKFEILVHEETFDADGRPAAGIVVRRRAERRAISTK